MYNLRSLAAAVAILVLAAASIPLFTYTADAARARASNSASCLPGVLKRRLSQLRSRFGSIRVISTFRRGARIAGTGRRSYHASCRAVDFLPPRGKYRAVANWLKKNHFGGVGTYSCGMYHIHIDNGPRVRFHKCGRRSSVRYAKRSRRGSRKATYRKRQRRVATRKSTRRTVRRTAGNRALRKTVVTRQPRRTLANRFANNRDNVSAQ